MRRKHQHAFGENSGAGRAQGTDRGITGFGLRGIAPARPAGDRVLHLIKAGEVGFISGTVHSAEILQTGFIVIVVGQLENGFLF